MNLEELQLLQLCDSALPIGALAHSFGLETLVDERRLSVDCLFDYLSELLLESLLLEAVFCRTAHARDKMEELNQTLSALKPARESRQASLSLGRRFLTLAAHLHPSPELQAAARCEQTHFSIAFGYVAGFLNFNADATVTAYLHQSVLGIISAAQRLLPLGQVYAAQIAWDLKPRLLQCVLTSASISVEKAGCFAHLPELASMRHPHLTTRLFIS